MDYVGGEAEERAYYGREGMGGGEGEIDVVR